MLRTLGIVHACFEGQGPKPMGSRKLGGRPLLEWIVRRITDCQQLGGTVVLTDDAPVNAPVSDLVPLDVPVFVAKQSQDAVSRLLMVLDACPAEHVVCVGCRYPFLNPMWIDRLVSEAESAEGADFACYASVSDGDQSGGSEVAFDIRWVRTAALRRLDRKIKTARDRACLDTFFRSARSGCRTLSVRPPVEIADGRLQLALGSEEDWEEVLAVFDSLGTDGLDWQRIADLLDHQPSMHFRLAAERAAAHH